jgi:hypothetical protein
MPSTQRAIHACCAGIPQSGPYDYGEHASLVLKVAVSRCTSWKQKLNISTLLVANFELSASPKTSHCTVTLSRGHVF